MKLSLFYILFLLLGIFLNSPPKEINLDLSNAKPFQTWEHPLGCDKLGRDIYSLLSYGSLSVFLFSIPARILTLLISTFIVFITYSTNKWFQLFIDSFASVFLSLPSFLVALILLYSIGQSSITFFISILITDWAMVYESLNAKLVELKLSPPVLASRSMGASHFFIFKFHLLPEMLSLLRVLFITGIPSVIMTLSIFSFLGMDFGSDYLGAGLGEQISFSKDYVSSSPLSVFAPILGILFLLLILSK
jgi:peptide/nickel transport system permease protein